MQAVLQSTCSTSMACTCKFCKLGLSMVGAIIYSHTLLPFHNASVSTFLPHSELRIEKESTRGRRPCSSPMREMREGACCCAPILILSHGAAFWSLAAWLERIVLLLYIIEAQKKEACKSRCCRLRRLLVGVGWRRVLVGAAFVYTD